MAITYDEERAEMLDFLPQQRTSVLDVGCSTGGFGKLLRSAGVTRLVGVEPNDEAAERATSTYDQVVVGRFPDVAAELPEGAKYDVVFFNDVLEHMPEPELALRAAKSMLAPGGSIVCSIPNIKHISVMGPLLVRDEFRYRASGILDTTHVRFFTEKSMRRMFTDEGWTVVQLRGINRVLHIAETKNRAWIGWLGALTGGRTNRFFYVQYVVVAKPE